MDLSNPPYLPRRNKALDLLKWLAMASMVLDHLRYIGLPLNVLYVPGRLAFPWFCLAIAVNLARRVRGLEGPRVQWHYLGWLLLFAGLAEIPYRLYMPAGEAQTLNVLPTLALGMLVAQGWRHRSPVSRNLALAAVLLGALLQDKLMFGFFGVLLPWACLLVLERPMGFALIPGVVCLFSNAWSQIFAAVAWGDPISIGALIACVLAPMAGMLLLRVQPVGRVWPMRRWAYGIYPAHFLLLYGVTRLLA
jgi:hypothetical protein